MRLADMLAALAELKSPAPRYRRARAAGAPGVTGKPSDTITMDALYPRYAAFIQPSDNVVLESGSTSFGIPPLQLADGAQVHIQMLWGSIGWATGAAFGGALADPKRRTLLFTGEGSHQLTANEIGNMGRACRASSRPWRASATSKPSFRWPDLEGEIDLWFVIVGDAKVGGIVESVDVLDRSTLRDADFIECLRESFLGVTFPPPRGGGVITVEYPLIFSPSD